MDVGCHSLDLLDFFFGPLVRLVGLFACFPPVSVSCCVMIEALNSWRSLFVVEGCCWRCGHCWRWCVSVSDFLCYFACSIFSYVSVFCDVLWLGVDVNVETAVSMTFRLQNGAIGSGFFCWSFVLSVSFFVKKHFVFSVVEFCVCDWGGQTDHQRQRRRAVNVRLWTRR